MSSDEDCSSDSEIQFVTTKSESLSDTKGSLRRKYISVNNVGGLNQKLKDIKLNLDWAERLDITIELSTISEAVKVEKTQMKQNEMPENSAEDDFHREMMFYNQAKAAALRGTHQLHQRGILTKRPKDYFAEMAKSDSHMVKVREKLLSKQLMMERSEKARKLRELKKHGKKIQQEVLQKRQSEKKQIISSLNKYKKGQKDHSKLLEGISELKNSNNKLQNKNKFKKKFKDDRYGYGGQKKRSKYNTADSSAYYQGNRRNTPFKKKNQRQGKMQRKRNKKN